MEILKALATTMGVIIATLGVIGGVFSLPEGVKRFMKSLRAPGDKGVGTGVLSVDETPNEKIVTFLVIEDLFHFIGSFVGKEWGCKVKSIESVGEYYKVVVSYAPDADLRFYKVPKLYT
jgi:hypothetical protein